MKHCLLYLLTLVSLAVSCSPPHSKEESKSEITVSDTIAATESFTQNDQENITRLIRFTLTDLFKEDIEKGFLDSLSRQFKYSQVDLNEDGSLEILVGLTGPYFCGSGGCTVLLLTNHGDMITRFSVVKYPAYLGQESSNGWKNLILFSGGKNRTVQYNGTTYPSNPSTLEVYSGNVDNLFKVLDWENLEGFNF